MTRRLVLTGRGLRLTGGARAASYTPPPPPPPSDNLLVTETGATLVDELGRALSWGTG